jgi:manganese/zinc/iron transport system substrate-binding protein
MLEGKMEEILSRIAKTKPAYAVTSKLDASMLLDAEGMSGHHDPHVWMDPRLWAKAAHTV